MAWNVVVAGGGFAGLYAVRALERALPAHSARITIVSESNFLLYTPLLPAVAGGTLNPRNVTVPIREELKHAHLLIGRVAGCDPQRRALRFVSVEGEERELPYDQLIVALGSVSRQLPIPGLTEHAIGFKSILEALHLRDTLLRSLEIAEAIDRPNVRAQHLTFVVAGADTRASRRSPSSRTSGRRSSTSTRAAPSRACAGCSWRPRPVSCARCRGISLTSPWLSCDGAASRSSRARDWRPSPMPVCGSRPGRRCPHGRSSGRRASLPARRSRSWDYRRTNMAGSGSTASCRSRVTTTCVRSATARRSQTPLTPDQSCPPTAQHAMRQGIRVAGNVAAALGHGARRPFTFKTLGLVVDLGRRRAVAKIFGVKLRGFPAWFCARSYHMMAIPGIRRRIRLVIDWTIEVFYPRDSAEWIPARMPRLSLAVVRDPEAVEVSMRAESALAGEEPRRTPLQ